MNFSLHTSFLGRIALGMAFLGSEQPLSANWFGSWFGSSKASDRIASVDRSTWFGIGCLATLGYGYWRIRGLEKQIQAQAARKTTRIKRTRATIAVPTQDVLQSQSLVPENILAHIKSMQHQQEINTKTIQKQRAAISGLQEQIVECITIANAAVEVSATTKEYTDSLNEKIGGLTTSVETLKISYKTCLDPIYGKNSPSSSSSASLGSSLLSCTKGLVA